MNLFLMIIFNGHFIGFAEPSPKNLDECHDRREAFVQKNANAVAAGDVPENAMQFACMFLPIKPNKRSGTAAPVIPGEPT